MHLGSLLGVFVAHGPFWDTVGEGEELAFLDWAGQRQ